MLLLSQLNFTVPETPTMHHRSILARFSNIESTIYHMGLFYEIPNKLNELDPTVVSLNRISEVTSRWY
jgi:hypothetical protein